MPKAITEYRVFLASPGDLADERDAVVDVVNEINVTHGEPLDYRLRVVRYEIDAASGAGQPQQVVNEFVADGYDLFVGLMWKRFGSPTATFGSGTEEEYRLAYERWRRAPFPLLFYFLQKPFMPKDPDELNQLGQVLAFRRELAEQQFAWSCDDLVHFRDLVRKDLCLWMNRLLRPRHAPARPDAATVADLRSLWPRMDEGLQTAFSVAYNENRRVADGGVQTRDLFAALLRTQADALAPVVASIPEAALPPPTPGPIVTRAYIAQERPWLSHCVADSIRRLGAALPDGRKLTALDVFTDIARHGTGESVRLLREHQVMPADIERILAERQLAVVERR